MKNISISLKEAQTIILTGQKLIGPTQNPQQIIEHLGYVQIDTISVVERAHHHVFWTRNHSYRPIDLEQLVKSRKVFEYWSHAASYLPMNEYRFSLPMKRAFRKKETSWFPRDAKLMSAVLKRIGIEGALRAKDFENSKKGKTGWWDWKPAKNALERLFLEGSLEITRREGFQKVYDLPERVIPNLVDTTMPTDQEYTRFLIHRTLRHHGLATVGEIAYLKRRETKIDVQKRLAEMLENGEVIQVDVEGITDTYFAFSGALDNIISSRSNILILSPFDNMVIQRKKLKAFFNFNYKIECYIPAKKRKYGYFCLPVFNGSKAIARIDCKADRQNQQLLIHSVHYEKGFDQTFSWPKLESRLKSFARFNGCKLSFTTLNYFSICQLLDFRKLSSDLGIYPVFSQRLCTDLWIK